MKRSDHGYEIFLTGNGGPWPFILWRATSGAVTTRDSVAGLSSRYAGWCECRLLVDRSLLRVQEYPRCPSCGCDWAVAGVLKLGDARVDAILDAFQGARSRLERRRSTMPAMEEHLRRASGGALIR